MAKEFKDYDKLYAQYHGKALDFIKQQGGSIARSDIDDIQKWDIGYEVYDQRTVQHAVYYCCGADAWQKFRVGLKGLSTREKLYALGWWLAADDGLVHRIQVMNYIGALKRGGQLNDDLEVVR